eukprot:Lankesteria_metandrocarpae@DN188_c0_g1_i2.p1
MRILNLAGGGAMLGLCLLHLIPHALSSHGTHTHGTGTQSGHGDASTDEQNVTVLHFVVLSFLVVFACDKLGISHSHSGTHTTSTHTTGIRAAAESPANSLGDNDSVSIGDRLLVAGGHTGGTSAEDAKGWVEVAGIPRQLPYDAMELQTSCLYNTGGTGISNNWNMNTNSNIVPHQQHAAVGGAVKSIILENTTSIAKNTTG